jgi:hypothetical protein
MRPVSGYAACKGKQYQYGHDKVKQNVKRFANKSHRKK